MTLEIPELKEVATRLERIEKLLAAKETWLSKKEFCQKYDVPESTFNIWRGSGTIVTKKIGKHVFVDLVRSMK